MNIISAWRGRGSPYTHFAHGIPDRPRGFLQQARYQIVPGSHGVPVAQVELNVSRSVPGIPNPDMSLALVIDRSGSMTHTYREGHVLNAASAVFNNVTGGQGAGGELYLAFYDSQPTFVGRVTTLSQLQNAIARHAPNGGGTQVSATLRGVIKQYRKHGIYIIVITDGEFADKLQVQTLVLNEIAPMLTADNPNAVRLHFIGAGEEVDKEFLRQLESDAAARGVTLVKQHHHAHLSHSHTSMLDEMDALYVGLGRDVRIEAPDGALLRSAQLQSATGGTNQGRAPVWQEGHVFTTPFLPRRSLLAFEYASPHTGGLPLSVSYTGADGAAYGFRLTVPLPQADRHGRAAAPPASGGRGGLLGALHRKSPEERAAAEAAARLVRETREAELARQHDDVIALRHGRIPSSARARLQELAADENAFTSDLAPDEMALLRHGGFRARGLVTGSAVYHVGQAYASSSRDCEVVELSSAYNEATRLAVSRMEQEVRALGAAGAVGVRYTVVRHEWAERTVEVRIVGTAVSGPGSGQEHPWLSDLSGQEWWALRRAGYDAAGLVYGHCTWFVLTSDYDEMIKRSFQNAEFRHQSEGLAHARRIALRHVLTQAKAVKAHGVTGVTIGHRLDEVRLTGPGENSVYEYEHHNIVLSIIGTAIRLRKDAPRQIERAVPILSLRDGRMVPAVVHAVDASLE